MQQKLKRPSIFNRIVLRLLIFNSLLVFLPEAAFLYLETYEKKLLQAHERTLYNQARIAAAFLTVQPLDKMKAEAALEALKGQQEARIRIIDNNRRLLADTSQIIQSPPNNQQLLVQSDEEATADIPRLQPDSGEISTSTGQMEPQNPLSANETMLYRFGSFPFRIYRAFFPPEEPIAGAAEFYNGKELFNGQEIEVALIDKRYGSATRISSGQNSVTLYSALPIIRNNKVEGVVLVSQSSAKILYDLYEIRLDIFKIFILSVTAAIIISLILSSTILRPIKKLIKRSTNLLDNKGKIQGNFKYRGMKDEIWQLSESLTQLTGKIQHSMNELEQFSSDAAHELKNPIASIQAAAEILEDQVPNETVNFAHIISKESKRMNRLLISLKELSMIGQSEADKATIMDVKEMINESLCLFQLKHKELKLTGKLSKEKLLINAPTLRMRQVFDNLLDNCCSFSPLKGKVHVSAEKLDKRIIIKISDEGAGIPESEREAVFERFYTTRNKSEGLHSGLGLSIVRRIIEESGGTIVASGPKKPQNGTIFILELPSI